MIPRLFLKCVNVENPGLINLLQRLPRVLDYAGEKAIAYRLPIVQNIGYKLRIQTPVNYFYINYKYPRGFTAR